MIPNVIQFIVDGFGNVLNTPTETIKGRSNYQSIIQVVCPTKDNILIKANYTNKGTSDETFTDYLIKVDKKGHQVINPDSPYYEETKLWDVFEVSLTMKNIVKIARFEAVQIGIDFDFLLSEKDNRAIKDIGTFGVGNDIKDNANNGDYMTCISNNYYSVKLDETLAYNQVVIFLNGKWELAKQYTMLSNTGTQVLGIDPTIVGVVKSVVDPNDLDIIFTKLNELESTKATKIELEKTKKNVENNANRIERLEETTTDNKSNIERLDREVKNNTFAIDGLGQGLMATNTSLEKFRDETNEAIANINLEIENVRNEFNRKLLEKLDKKPNGITPLLNNAGKIDPTYLDFSGNVGDIVKIVDELPEIGEPNIIYLVPKTSNLRVIDIKNDYDEYIWVNGAYEQVGVFSIDLADYYTKDETDAIVEVLNTKLDDKASIEDIEAINLKFLDYAKLTDLRMLVGLLSEFGDNLFYMQHAIEMYNKNGLGHLFASAWEDMLDAIKEVGENNLDSIGKEHYPNADINGIILPYGQKIVKMNGFKDMVSFNKPIVFPDTIENISSDAFRRMTSMNSIIELPIKVRYIGQYAFYDWVANTHDIKVPSNLKSFSGMPFAVTKAKFAIHLESDTLVENKTDLVNTAFDGVVYVPDNLVEQYKNDRNWKNNKITSMSDYYAPLKLDKKPNGVDDLIVNGKVNSEYLNPDGIPSYYEMATDDDFVGTSSGSFKYIGTKEYVIIPNVIKDITNTRNYNMFRDNTTIKGVANLKDNKVLRYDLMFKGANLTSLELKYLHTQNADTLGNMFESASIPYLDLSSFTHEKITSKSSMFYLGEFKNVIFKNKDEAIFFTTDTAFPPTSKAYCKETLLNDDSGTGLTPEQELLLDDLGNGTIKKNWTSIDLLDIDDGNDTSSIVLTIPYDDNGTRTSAEFRFDSKHIEFADTIDGVKISGVKEIDLMKDATDSNQATRLSQVNALLNTQNTSLTNKINAVDNNLQLQIDDLEYVKNINIIGNKLVISYKNNSVVEYEFPQGIVGGSYDNATKELVLELQNGSEIRIPAGDITEDLASITYVNSQLLLKENIANKITQINGALNDTQYMSAKLTNDLIGEARAELNAYQIANNEKVNNLENGKLDKKPDGINDLVVSGKVNNSYLPAQPDLTNYYTKTETDNRLELKMDINVANDTFVAKEVGKSLVDNLEIDKLGRLKLLQEGTSATTYLNGTGTYTTPPNTTYALLSQANLTNGTETTGRLVSAKLLRDNFYNKSEIDGKFVVKDTTAGKVYTTDGVKGYSQNILSEGLVQRDVNGGILTTTPTNANSAVNKSYVDDNFYDKTYLDDRILTPTEKTRLSSVNTLGTLMPIFKDDVGNVIIDYVFEEDTTYNLIILFSTMDMMYCREVPITINPFVPNNPHVNFAEGIIDVGMQGKFVYRVEKGDYDTNNITDFFIKIIELPHDGSPKMNGYGVIKLGEL